MKLFFYGTMGDDLNMLKVFNQRCLYHCKEGTKSLAFETDETKTTRSVPPFVKAVLDPAPRPIHFPVPLPAYARKFKEGEFTHFDFNSRELLCQNLTSGRGHLRQLGNITYLLRQPEHRSILSQMLFGDPALNSCITISSAWGGGSGSSATPNVLADIQHLIQQGGGNLQTEVHVFGVLQPAGTDDLLSQRECCNEAATAREVVSLILNGACFPNTSREGWEQPQSCDTKILLWLCHDPGNRGLDFPSTTASMGLGLYLLYEDPRISQVFQRDAINRFNLPTEAGPCCSTFGLYRIYTPDLEEHFLQCNYLCQEAIKETLTPQGDYERQAIAFLREHRMAEDGRTPGLSSSLLEEVFKGRNPLAEKLSRKPPRGLTIRSRLERVRRWQQQIRSELSQLLGQVKRHAAQATQNYREKLYAQLSGQLRCASVATVLKTTEAMSTQFERMSLKLQETIGRYRSQAEQTGQHLAQLSHQEQVIAQDRIRKHLSIRYRSIPTLFQTLATRQVSLEADAALHEITLEAQRTLRESLTEFSSHLTRLHETLKQTQSHFDSLASSLASSAYSHRGLGQPVKVDHRFMDDKQRSGLDQRFGETLSGRLRDFLATHQNCGLPALTKEEIADFLSKSVESILAFEDSNIFQALDRLPEREELLNRAYRQAAPLLAVEPIHESRNELCLILLPGGENSPFKEAFLEIAVRSGATQAPVFIHWQQNEIVILRVEFNIPLRYVLPLQRAERVLKSASLDEQITSFRLPILWLLPPITLKPSEADNRRTLLLAAAAGLAVSSDGGWVYTAKSGDRTEIPDLSPDTLARVFQPYHLRSEAASWFCHETLYRGFSWAFEQLRTLGQEMDFKKGACPGELLKLQNDLKTLAKRHHQDT